MIINTNFANWGEFFSEATTTVWFSILASIVGVMIGRMIAKQLTYKVLDRIMRSHKYVSEKEKLQRRDTLVGVFITIITFALVVVALITILYAFGVNLSALVASFGAAGVVFGIAGQAVLKDFFKGMAILVYDQLRVGDIVKIAGVSGFVEHVSLLITRLRDLDGNVHIVPNGEITVVTNLSLEHANVNLDLAVAYDSDIDKVEEVINNVGKDLATDEKWQNLILEPVEFLRVDAFADHSINIKALGKVLPGEQWAVAGEYRRRIKKAFDNNGITIPYPQLVLHNQSIKDKQGKK